MGRKEASDAWCSSDESEVLRSREEWDRLVVNADIATSDHLWFAGDKHLLLEIPGENEANYLLLPYRRGGFSD